MCTYIECLNLKYYARVRIFFKLNVYITLQWLFGRLYGVHVQVEDDLMPIHIFYAIIFGFLGCSALIRMSTVLFTLQIYIRGTNEFTM